MRNAARKSETFEDLDLQETRLHPTHFSICYTPRPGGALASFGRSWFGRSNDGATLQAFSASGIADAQTSPVPPSPNRYLGLHAAFFAPLKLRAGAKLDDVSARLASFAARRKPVETGPLELVRTRRTLALRPVRPCQELDWLALQCFNAFDSFAAPAETALEAYPHLSPYQRLLLKSFGQPGIMSEFRFSIPLTGPLDAHHLDRVAEALEPLTTGLRANGVCIDGLTLVAGRPGPESGPENGNRQASPARLLGRYALSRLSHPLSL